MANGTGQMGRAKTVGEGRAMNHDHRDQQKRTWEQTLSIGLLFR